LERALVCTVLATPSQQKNTLLMNIFKDERSHLTAGYPVIKEMYFERIIKEEQVRAGMTYSFFSFQLLPFVNLLEPHQRVMDKVSGITTLQRANVEHNVRSLARLYKCVTFASVAELLGISLEMVEKTVTRMISSGLLRGTVDQIEQLITFEG
jgi:hypothetical protein